jgi:hypothetical protein
VGEDSMLIEARMTDAGFVGFMVTMEDDGGTSHFTSFQQSKHFFVVDYSDLGLESIQAFEITFVKEVVMVLVGFGTVAGEHERMQLSIVWFLKLLMRSAVTFSSVSGHQQ